MSLTRDEHIIAPVESSIMLNRKLSCRNNRALLLKLCYNTKQIISQIKKSMLEILLIVYATRKVKGVILFCKFAPH